MAISQGVLGIDPIEPSGRIFSVNPQRFGDIEVERKGRSGTATIPASATANLGNGKWVKGPDRIVFAR